MSVQLNFTLEFSDYVDAQRLHARRNWWLCLNYYTARFVLPVLGVCLIVIGSLNVSHGVPSALSVFNLGLGVFLVFYPWYYRARLKRCYRRTRTGDGEISVELGESMIHVKTENSNSELTWKAVQSFLEDQKLFMLYLAPAKFIALPKRVFSPEQIVELQSFLASQVKAAS
jgi:YcxB-like protein